MSGRCCIKSCKQSYVKGGPSMHKFPKNPARRKAWVDMVGEENIVLNVHSTLCSKHFKDDCFDRNKLGGTWLKPDALPTEFEHSKRNNSTNNVQVTLLCVQNSPKLTASPLFYVPAQLPIIQNNSSSSNGKVITNGKLPVIQNNSLSSSIINGQLPVIQNNSLSSSIINGQLPVIQNNSSSSSIINGQLPIIQNVNSLSSNITNGQSPVIQNNSSSSSITNESSPINERIKLEHESIPSSYKSGITVRQLLAASKHVTQTPVIISVRSIYETDDSSISTPMAVKDEFNKSNSKDDSSLSTLMAVEDEFNVPNSGTERGVKRFSYIGDFKEDDITSIDMAKRAFTIAQNQISKYKKRIKNLRQNNKRLKKRVGTLKGKILQMKNNRHIYDSDSSVSEDA